MLFRSTVNPYIFLGGALFSLLTVVISCKKPSGIAAKVSPIEAVKYTEVKAIKAVNRKSRRINPFRMAMANMTRNKGKTVVVVISLSLAIFILQITVLFTNGFDMEKYIEKFAISDFLIGNVNYFNSMGFNEVDALSEEEITTLSTLDGVKGSGVVYGKLNNNFAFYDSSDFRELYRDYYSTKEIEDITEWSNKRGTNEKGQILNKTMMYGMDKRCLEKIKVFEGSAKQLAKNQIVAVYNEDDYGAADMQSNSKKIGDTITIRYVSEMGYFDDVTNKRIKDIENTQNEYYEKPLSYVDVDYEVVALATVPNNMGYRMWSPGKEIFAVSADHLLATTTGFEPMNLMLDVEQDKVERVETQLKAYTTTVNTMLDFESRGKLEEEFQSFKSMFFMVGGLLSIIVGTIGTLNFFNVILTSITMRKREFAMLQSIGMTGKQLKQTLIYESISYIILTAMVVSGITVLSMPMLTRVMSGMFWFYTSNFTIAPTLTLLPIFLLIGIATPLVLYRMLVKQSIVERLREAE